MDIAEIEKAVRQGVADASMWCLDDEEGQEGVFEVIMKAICRDYMKNTIDAEELDTQGVCDAPRMPSFGELTGADTQEACDG